MTVGCVFVSDLAKNIEVPALTEGFLFPNASITSSKIASRVVYKIKKITKKYI